MAMTGANIIMMRMMPTIRIHFLRRSERGSMPRLFMSVAGRFAATAEDDGFIAAAATGGD